MAFDLYKNIDTYVGGTLAYLLGLFKIRHEDLQPKRILVVRLWAMGDSILVLAILDALKKKFPQAQVDVLCRRRNKAFFMGQNLDSIKEFEWAHLLPLFLSFNQYDVVVDTEQYLNLSALLSWWLGSMRVGFSHGVRSKLYTHTADYNREIHMLENYNNLIEHLQVPPAKKLVPVKVKKEWVTFIDQYLKKHGLAQGMKIGVQTTVAESSKTRLWTDDKWAKTLDSIVEKYGAQILFIGGPNDLAAHDRIIQKMEHPGFNCAGLSKKQSCELISRLDCMISLDTGPLHLAAAQGVPVVGLYGPNTPKLWSPYNDTSIAIYKDVPCSPCIQNDKGYMPPCLRKDNKHWCMKAIMPKDVISAVEGILG